MPLVKRTADFFDIEPLRFASGLEAIESYVIDSSTVPEYPVGSGRYIVLAGTVLAKIPASNKVQPVTHSGGGTGSAGAYVAADIVGILGTTIEFLMGPQVAAGGNLDEPCDVLFHECVFNVSKLTGYVGNETIVKSALPTCKFY